ncbi:MAG: LysM peptidoglycan-binding domain-containing protein [Parachlamydiaceae bacterium]
MILHHDEKLSKIRFLTLALFISGSFNILLLAFLFYWAFLEKPSTNFYQLKPKTESSLLLDEELFNQVRYLKFNELIERLSRGGFQEEQDLALSVLVTFYDFDIQRALSSSLTPLVSKMALSKTGEKMIVFPYLNEEQRALIVEFAKKEKWPLKGKGLFFMLKQPKFKQDPSLIDAFYLTEEFILARNLCARSLKNIFNEELLAMLLEGQWKTLADFCQKQKKMQDLTTENRRKFFLDYLKQGSRTSAFILLKTDWEYAVNHLKDELVVAIMQLLNDEAPELIKYASSVLASPRGDLARQVAQKRLDEVRIKRTKIQEQVLVALPKDKLKGGTKVREKTYFVRDGDSLWKIAKKHHVDVEKLKRHNQLSSDFLKPGTVLKIPDC